MDIIQRIASDDDLLIIAAVAFILWRDKADKMLILALIYVFLIK